MCDMVTEIDKILKTFRVYRFPFLKQIIYIISQYKESWYAWIGTVDLSLDIDATFLCNR